MQHRQPTQSTVDERQQQRLGEARAAERARDRLIKSSVCTKTSQDHLHGAINQGFFGLAGATT